MANSPWDRVIINERERPLSSDINLALSQLDQTARDLLMHSFARRLSGPFDNTSVLLAGFIGSSFKVRPGTGVVGAPGTLSMDPGHGFSLAQGPDTPANIDLVSNLNDISVYKPLISKAPIPLMVPVAPGPGFERYDIVEIKAGITAGTFVDRRRVDLSSRDVLDPGTGVFGGIPLLKTLTFLLDAGEVATVISPANNTTGIGYKVGVTAVVGAALVPAVSPGYIKLCEIYVGPAVAVVDYNVIRDLRPFLAPYGQLLAACRCSVDTGTGVVTVTNVNTPPGMVLAAIPSGAPAAGGCQIFLWGGAPPNFVAPPTPAFDAVSVSAKALHTGGGFPPATAPVVMVTEPDIITGVTIAIQPTINGGSSSPAVGAGRPRVAVGQPAVFFRCSGLPAPLQNPFVYNVQVRLKQ